MPGLFPGLNPDSGPAPEPAPGSTEPPAGPGPHFASVAPAAPVAGAFTYRVPAKLREQVALGVRVKVPFGGRRLEGFVVELSERCDLPPKKLRSLLEVVDPTPLLSPDVLELARWAADYYASSLGEVLAAAVPKGVSRPGRPDVRRVWWRRRADAEPGRLGKKQAAVWEALAAGPLREAELRAQTPADPALLRRLVELGLIESFEPDSDADAPVVAPTAELPELTAGQKLALAPLLRQIQPPPVGPATPGTAADPAADTAPGAVPDEGAAPRPEPRTTLLFGITGSGKTEVYLRAIARALELGLGAIVLVPEIALTPQTLARFEARFGDTVAALHSGLGARERRLEWRRVKEGRARVVVGPRSAVWAPVPRLGLLVVDEEHESTYKQESAPRYHARDLAVVRGKLAGVPVILGSATPALESYRNAVAGRYRIARLTSRPGESQLPRVRIVDMGEEWAEVKGAPLLSRALVQEIRAALPRGERALLFMNRRGFTTFLQCTACGHVLKCDQCDVALTVHKAMASALCHFCDASRPPPDGPCPACLGPPLRRRGAGTERIEDVVKQLFPEARVGRLDTDVVRGGETAEEVLERFRTGEINVLIGTQMIAKGLDVAEVTVVGVVSADTSLSLPDFRASERTFQLVAQVAGRAGRGQRPGATVIQTFSPRHFAIRAAASHDFEAFARTELEAREGLRYPPYSRLLKLLLRGPDEAQTLADANRLVESIVNQNLAGVLGVLGPAPSPRAYLASKYRFQVLIKADAGGVRRALALARAFKPGSSKVEVVVDVDPYHLL